MIDHPKHGEPGHVQPDALHEIGKLGHALALTTPALEELFGSSVQLARRLKEALDWWETAAPEQKAQRLAEQRAHAERARERRAQERAVSDRVPLTVDILADRLGWTREYAEHFVQPYCECEDTRDGWDYCEHARDLGHAS